MDWDKVKAGDRLEIVALRPRYFPVPEQGLEIGRKVTVTRIEGITAEQAMQVWAVPDDAVESWMPCSWGFPFLSYNLGEITEAVCDDTK